jgi:hypothetical protein
LRRALLLQAAAVSRDDSINIRTLPPPPLYTKRGEPEVDGERHKQWLTENMKEERMLVKYRILIKENTCRKRGNWSLRNKENG